MTKPIVELLEYHGYVISNHGKCQHNRNIICKEFQFAFGVIEKRKHDFHKQVFCYSALNKSIEPVSTYQNGKKTAYKFFYRCFLCVELSLDTVQHHVNVIAEVYRHQHEAPICGSHVYRPCIARTAAYTKERYCVF